MIPLSILGLFCEDIREEIGGTVTLIGLIPDNVNVEFVTKGHAPGPTPQKTKSIYNLCIFARANFDPDDPVQQIDLALAFPDDSEIPLGGITTEIAESKQEAKRLGSPLAGVIMRVALVGFTMKQSGVVRLMASVDGKNRAIAMLNFSVSGANAASSEPPQPASRSSGAARRNVN